MGALPGAATSELLRRKRWMVQKPGNFLNEIDFSQGQKFTFQQVNDLQDDHQQRVGPQSPASSQQLLVLNFEEEKMINRH